MESRDVFIAYHGTYDKYGSLERAKGLFRYLESKGVKCYFFRRRKVLILPKHLLLLNTQKSDIMQQAHKANDIVIEAGVGIGTVGLRLTKYKKIIFG